MFTASKNYRKWIKHNKIVQASGFGACLCWRCWKEMEKFK